MMLPRELLRRMGRAAAVEIAEVFSPSVPIAPCDELLYCTDGDRSLILAGKRYAPILDSYQDAGLVEGRSFLTISPLLSECVGAKAYGRVLKAGVIVTGLHIAAWLLDRLILRRRGGVDLRTRLNRWRYTRVLRLAKPNRVVGIQPEPDLLWAARQLGIETVDIQHGDITGGVPYYLPMSGEGASERIVPDCFFVWDEPSARVIDTLAGHFRTRAVVTGNFWIERHKRGGVPFLESYFSAQKARAEALVQPSAGPAVLVTLQWDLSKFHPKYYARRKFVADALFDAIRLRKDFTWVIRPHPLMSDHPDFMAEMELLQRETAIVVAWPSQVTLPALLSLCQVHITWHSSTVIEATQLGVPSLVLSPESYYYAELGAANKTFPLPYTDYEATGLVSRPSNQLRRGAAEILEFLDAKFVNRPTTIVGAADAGDARLYREDRVV